MENDEILNHFDAQYESKRVAECLLTASGRDGVGFSRDVEAEVLRQLCSLG